MTEILVTGGAGYIGSHTLRELKARGYVPVCFDNLSTGFRQFAGDARFYHGDLADAARLDQAFRECRITAVVHFASHALVGESFRNPHKYYRDNINNALNLLEAMRARGVKHIVFSSSCATYGIPGRLPIDESMPLDPINPYGVTKMVIERILADYRAAYGIGGVSLRYFNAAGAAPDGTIGEWHVPESHLIPRLLEVATGDAPAAEIYGDDYPTPDGTCVRDYIHVTDLASAHLNAIEYLLAGKVPDVFNLGAGQGYSVRQVVEAVRRATRAAIPCRTRPRRAGDPPELVADPGKARSALQWIPRHSSLDEIVETAWNWRRGSACRDLSAQLGGAAPSDPA